MSGIVLRSDFFLRLRNKFQALLSMLVFHLCAKQPQVSTLSFEAEVDVGRRHSQRQAPSSQLSHLKD